MKVIKLFSIFALAGLIFASVASAASDKIGYVDLSRLFDQYEKTKEYDAVLEIQHKEYESERNSRVEQLKTTQNKLSLMKESEKEKLQNELDKMRAELLEFDRQQQTELRKKRDEKIREILLEIEDIVKKYAKKNKYDVILNDRVLIYGQENLDITEKILSNLNSGFSKKK